MFSFTAVIAIVYVYKTIKLERKGCNVLVTTRDKGYVIKLTQSRTHVTSRGIVFAFLVLGRDLVELM